MASINAPSNLALLTMAVPAIPGAVLCWLRPAEAWLWALAVFFLPASWFGLRAAFRALRKTTAGAIVMGGEDAGDARDTVSLAVAVSSLVVALPLAARLADTLGWIEPSAAHAMATRWTNVVSGGYLVFRGNHLPKVLTPLSELRCDPAVLDMLKRRTGWLIVLAGFAYSVLWLALPTRLALPVGAAVIVAGVVAPSLILRSYAKGLIGNPARRGGR
jgi:hypothetical protein